MARSVAVALARFVCGAVVALFLAPGSGRALPLEIESVDGLFSARADSSIFASFDFDYRDKQLASHTDGPGPWSADYTAGAGFGYAPRGEAEGQIDALIDSSGIVLQSAHMARGGRYDEERGDPTDVENYYYVHEENAGSLETRLDVELSVSERTAFWLRLDGETAASTPGWGSTARLSLRAEDGAGIFEYDLDDALAGLDTTAFLDPGRYTVSFRHVTVGDEQPGGGTSVSLAFAVPEASLASLVGLALVSLPLVGRRRAASAA